MKGHHRSGSHDSRSKRFADSPFAPERRQSAPRRSISPHCDDVVELASLQLHRVGASGGTPPRTGRCPVHSQQSSIAFRRTSRSARMRRYTSPRCRRTRASATNEPRDVTQGSRRRAGASLSTASFSVGATAPPSATRRGPSCAQSGAPRCSSSTSRKGERGAIGRRRRTRSAAIQGSRPRAAGAEDDDDSGRRQHHPAD